MSSPSLFSKNLVQFRSDGGFKQRDLADRLKVSKSTVGKWEASKTLPPMETIERIAEFFDIDIYELFLPIRDEKPVTEANLYTKAINMLTRSKENISRLEESLADIPSDDYERQVIQNDIGMERDNYLNAREFVGELFGKTKLEVSQDVTALAEQDEPFQL